MNNTHTVRQLTDTGSSGLSRAGWVLKNLRPSRIRVDRFIVNAIFLQLQSTANAGCLHDKVRT